MSKPTIFGREPALILGALGAVIALAVGFGLELTAEQTSLIIAAATAILAVVTRSQVTPVDVIDYEGKHIGPGA